MTEQPETSTQQYGDLPHDGVIYIDLFELNIPVFTNHSLMVDTLIDMGTGLDPAVKGFSGLAATCYYKSSSVGEGMAFYAHPTCPQHTLANQVSYMVGRILEMLDLPQGRKSNTLRAYLCGHIFQQLDDILMPLLEDLFEDNFDQMASAQRKEVIH